MHEPARLMVAATSRTSNAFTSKERTMAQSPDTRTIPSTGDTSIHKEGEPKGHTVAGHGGVGERSTPAADASTARLSENTQQATHQVGDALRRSGAAGSEATRIAAQTGAESARRSADTLAEGYRRLLEQAAQQFETI